MTVGILDALLRPASVALIGASRNAGSVGAVVARNRLRGGFKGPIWPVNPHEAEIDCVRAFHSVADLLGVADLGMPRPGDVALVAQSGAVLASVIDWSAREIGFSHLVSLGGIAHIDAGDLLDYLALEPDVRGIPLYFEAATRAREFMAEARHAAGIKPVVVFKASRHEAAEFGILVRSDLKGLGLGWSLMREMIAYARGQGVQVLFGRVLRDNTQMLQMCRELGFTTKFNREDPGLVMVTIGLQDQRFGASVQRT